METEIQELTPLRVLFIEDCDDDAMLQVRMLRQAGYDVSFERVDTAVALTRALDSKWEIIISDYFMPHFNGTQALQMVRAFRLDVPFIFVSGTIGEEAAVAALKVGAQDYLMKTNLQRLVPSVRRELREAEERRQRRRLEQQVSQLQRFEAIGRLAGGVAHDFNNMIGAIMGWTDMACDEAEPGSRIQSHLHKIRSQADRAAALTRQLLAFARRQILQPRNINLNDLVKDEINLLCKIIGERVEVRSKFEDDPCVICADPTQIEQVLMNLCLNARDAMPAGGPLVIETCYVQVDDVFCRTHPYASPGRYALLRVSDAGIGMDPSILDHIFEPFFSTKATGEGTGLGLATVYGIVKQHKGFITVDSSVNAGATFYVYLPAAEGVVELPTKALEEKHTGGTETILVAEDNEAIREVAKANLEKLGYRVLLAADGAAALEIFEQERGAIDLVLLDVVMPNLNGPDAYARISAMRPGTPVLFTTGYAAEASVDKLRTCKEVVILQKPYNPSYLAQKVRQLLDARHP